MPSIKTICLILLTLFLFACKHQEDVAVYIRYKQEDGSYFVSSSTYRINTETQIVILLSSAYNAVEKYSDCAVQDSENWTCDKNVRISSGELTKSSFGFDRGDYFDFAIVPADIVNGRLLYISKWEYWYYKIKEYIR